MIRVNEINHIQGSSIISGLFRIRHMKKHACSGIQRTYLKKMMIIITQKT